MMRRLRVAMAAGVALSVPGLALGADEIYFLRAPGAQTERCCNEVALWMTQSAAIQATVSISGTARSLKKDLLCVLKPGTRAKILDKQMRTVEVEALTGPTGGCSGFIRQDFLSKD